MIDALTKAKQIVGNSVKLAELLGITSQAVGQWRRVPVARVLEIERLTEIPRHELRPDIYPPPDQK